MERTNISQRTGNGANMVRDYDQRIQYRTYRTVCTAKFPQYGLDRPFVVTALVRFDDDCGNGHCTFSVTGSVLKSDKQRAQRDPTYMCGCIHDVLAVAFPELAPVIQYHLFDTNGPMHYVTNTVYLAGDRDCWGRRKGDVSSWEYGVKFADSPVTHKTGRNFWEFLQALKVAGGGEFQVTAIAHEDRAGETYKFRPKYTLVGFGGRWHECPFDSQVEADEFAQALNTCKVEFVQIPTAYNDGKARELDSARATANWPEATDAGLSVEPDVLKAALLARLPAMIEKFRAVVESLGFDYEFPAKGEKRDAARVAILKDGGEVN